MNDLINRQAAIEACLRYNGVGWVWSQILDEIEKLPSAQQCEYWESESNHCALYRPSAQPIDAVEVVRCKDCKHYQFADNRAFGFPVKRCEWTGFEDVDDDDFCSRGERKDA